jgi:acyl carrier protein
MREIRSKIESIILEILKEKNVQQSSIAPDDSLLEDGLGLDSLDLAELSVALEHQLGRDPFSEGVFPSTLRDLCRYYETGEEGE